MVPVVMTLVALRDELSSPSGHFITFFAKFTWLSPSSLLSLSFQRCLLGTVSLAS